jgi:hypothetical protein
VVSEKGDVRVTALGDGGNVQLNANGGKAFVFGKGGVYVWADGFGVQGTKDALTLGKVNSPGKFTAPDLDQSCRLQMKATEITCYCGQAGYALRDKKVTLFTNGRAGELILDGSNVQVEANRICLG